MIAIIVKKGGLIYNQNKKTVSLVVVSIFIFPTSFASVPLALIQPTVLQERSNHRWKWLQFWHIQDIPR
ncbi:MAG: hypothetical protein QXP55_04535 [Nitrososphaerales archaeon]